MKVKVMMMKHPHGFTLIEIAVAATMITTISAIGMAVFVHAQKTTMEARTRGQMERDAQLIHDSIQRDLQYFGAGVPAGCNSQTANTVLDGQFLRPVMRIGQDHAMAFLGDLPFPNSEFSGMAIPVELDSPFFQLNHRIAVASEISGSCVPPDTGASAAHRCDTTLATLIPGTYGPTDSCDSSQPNARTCPWGMNKWPSSAAADQVFWTFVDPGGNWYERSNKEPAPYANVTIDGRWVGIHLSHSVGDKDFQGSDLWDNSGGAYISMIDRVFWAIEDSTNNECTPTGAGVPGDCEVKRLQCWGRLTANNLYPSIVTGVADGFPNTGAIQPGNCTTGATNGGTGWETVATNVKDVRFKYFGTNATTPLVTPLGTSAVQLAAAICSDPVAGPLSPAGTKSQVRSVEVTVDLERAIPGTGTPPKTVRYTQSRRFVLPSRESTL